MEQRKLLMIPGPIEFDPTVLETMSTPTPSHVAPGFIRSFGNALNLMKKVWLSPIGQPFVVSGSGTLAMDMAACNLIENGDKVLVISTGFFGERYVELIKRYGADVTVLKAELGNTVPIEKIEAELASGNYKLVTITHVDTSTGVLVNPQPIAKLAKQFNTLSILDGVCSVAAEEFKMDEWGLDVVITASQKAIGVPPGLCLMMVSENALNTWKNRRTPVANYYCDWTNWLPIMQAYYENRPSYFATPPVNLILALEKSLELIVKEEMEKRFARHKDFAHQFRTAMHNLGIKTLPVSDDVASNALTACYYPEGVEGGSFLSKVSEEGVVVAGGLLPSLKTKYFRVGHMGIVNQNHINTTINAIKAALS